MKKFVLVLPMMAVFLLAGCKKDTDDKPKTPRISRIIDGFAEESITSDFTYNNDGTVQKIVSNRIGETPRIYQFTHYPNASAMHFMIDNVVTYVDSTIFNAQGNPVAAYTYHGANPYLMYTNFYDSMGQLERMEQNGGLGNVYITKYRWESGDCMEADNGQYAIRKSYLSDKEAQLGDAEMIPKLFTHGRVLLPNKHLLEGLKYTSVNYPLNYDYTWENGRISAVRTIDSGSIYPQKQYRLVYEN